MTTFNIDPAKFLQIKPRRPHTPQVPAMAGMAPMGFVKKPDPTFYQQSECPDPGELAEDRWNETHS